MQRLASIGLTILFISSLAACAPSGRNDGDGDGDGDGGDMDGMPTSCMGSETRCNGNVFQTCQDGTFADSQTCSPTQQCDPAFGCEDCPPGGCGPDPNVDCAAAAQNKSYIGCEYWPVDLDNAQEVLGEPFLGDCSLYEASAKLLTLPVCPAQGLGNPSLCDYGNTCPGGGACTMTPVCVLDAQGSPFAVVVSNPHPTLPAMVTLQAAGGASMSVSVAAGQVSSLFPQQLGMPDASVDHSGIQKKAYKLTSDRPIVAYQFNPLDNVGVFSNDASLLIPAPAFGDEYYALIYPTLARRPGAHDYSAYVTVVASAQGTTQVTVNATTGVRAGLNVPAFGPGSQTFTLEQFEVLNLEAGGTGDISGTLIECAPACGVFVGTEASGIGKDAGGNCCADHLEDSLFPASTWGKKFALARTKQRTNEPDLVRVMAQKAGTTVSFNPPPSLGTCGTLGPGQFCEVRVAADTEIIASEPVLIAHYLMSVGTAGGGNPSGDPAVSFAVPSEQFRNDYTFLVPAQYAENHVSLVAPMAGTVLLDGVDVTGQLAGFGSGEFKAGRVQVQPGQHKLVCNATCGVEVYGYDGAVSYLFAGGLDLETIVVE